MKYQHGFIAVLLCASVAGCGGDGGGAAPASNAPAGPAASTTLSSSVSSLALSVTGLTEYGVSGTPSSGLARTITITNTGSAAANGLTATPSTALPSGTAITSNTCASTLAPGASCAITITPGNTPNSAPGPTAPTPVNLNVSGSNTNTVGVSILVLTYGNVYQSGYIFAVDDTTPTTGSIGGKVAALVDQSGNMVWQTAFNAIPGINETSVASSTSCDGNRDGACNTQKIVAQYSSDPANSYAAGLCTQLIDTRSDWYLPAICELGYDTTGSNTGCGTSSTPTVQNMQSNLEDLSVAGGPNGNFYWSSTEYSSIPNIDVWLQDFQTGGASGQLVANKGNNLLVRCARTLTP
ncbi:MAG TPA: hypothetical protein VHB46_13420 [Burkholderiales bacterium]|nr:hypothetical protein [Burkholderiales bacterium]